METSFVHRFDALLIHLDPSSLIEPAFLGLLTAFAVFRIYMRILRSRGRLRAAWCVLNAVVAGLGIWAINFSAILALVSWPGVTYDPLVAVGSLASSIVLATGIAPAALRKGEWGPSLLSGTAIGVGALIAALQAIGFVTWNTAAVLIWHPVPLLSAAILGSGLAALALKLVRSSRNWRDRIAGAALLTVATMAQHLLAVLGLEISGDAAALASSGGISHQQMALTVTVVTVLLAGSALALAALDHWTRAIARHRVRELADAALEGLVLCDDGVIVDANATFASLVGLDRRELRGRAFTDLVRPEHRDRLPDIAGQLREIDLVSGDGGLVPTETVARQLVLSGRGRGVFAVRDLRQRKDAERRIQRLAYYDALTGLPNRALFRQRLEEGLAQARPEHGNLAVLCLDLDHFKRVNDTLGHPAGDALLCAVAERIRGCVREADTVARLGGDEFAIVLVSGCGPDDISALAGRLVERVGAPYDIEGHHVVVGTSVGIATAPDGGDDPDGLLRCADTALYVSKAAGRGSYCFFKPEMNARLQARRSLETDLRSALGNSEFELFFQPLISVETGAINGCEALLRWHHPRRGSVPPAEFIPLAEEIGLIVPLGEWVLYRACAEAAAWPSGVRLAVNLSALQFADGGLARMVASALAASRLPADRLELEITESVLLRESESNLIVLHELRALGVRISMDDFGTGYSSLSYLRSFPFDKLKIDRSFVTHLGESDECLAIVRAVMGLGRGLGIATVAEGVETEQQLKRLRLEGCSEVQGYLLGRPQPAEELRELLAASGRADDLATPSVLLPASG